MRPIYWSLAIVATLTLPVLAASPKPTPTPFSMKGVHLTDLSGRPGIVKGPSGRLLVGKNGAMAIVHRNGKTIMYMDAAGRMMMLDAKGTMSIRDEQGMRIKQKGSGSAEGKKMLAEFHQLQTETEAAK
jgi:hypothetical protein